MQNVQKCLNQNFIIGSFSESGFEPTLSGKPVLLSVWRNHFSGFFTFLSDKNETILSKSEAKRSKNSANQNLVVGSFLENNL